MSVTVKQVGPAPGQPRTTLAFEAVVIDWLPGARIPSWPGALGGSYDEAGDTSAVRPALLTATLTQPRRERLSEALSDLQLTGGVQILLVGRRR